VFVKLLVRQPPGLPDLFLRPWLTVHNDKTIRTHYSFKPVNGIRYRT